MNYDIIKKNILEIQENIAEAMKQSPYIVSDSALCAASDSAVCTVSNSAPHSTSYTAMRTASYSALHSSSDSALRTASYSALHSSSDSALRTASDITLVCVTKTIDFGRIQTLREVLHDLGHTAFVFGENRVQELVGKQEYFHQSKQHSPPISWHLIGHLQTNKVKFVVGKVDLIHSVDSIRLLEGIDRQAAKAGCCQDILIEVNIAEETSKHGLEKDDVSAVIARAADLPNIRVKGLMCMAPFYENKEDTRSTFRSLRMLANEVRQAAYANVDMQYLSMGMSNDYTVAIEEGANMVRLGSCIFTGTSEKG